MSFSNLSSTLTAWVDQNPDRFYTNAVLGARTAQLIKDKGILMAGVKNAKTINLIDTDSVFQDDSCGWNSSGTTTLTQRTVTVGKVKIQEALCIKSLEDYFTSQALAMGSMYESESDLFTALAEKFFEKKLGLTAQQVEIALWQGDDSVGNTNGNTNKWDGFIKLIKATNTPIISNSRVGTGTITTATNSTTVTGSSTLFTSQVAAGDKLYSGTTLIGTVSSITNATTIVLAANAAVAVTAGAYNIYKSSQTATTDVNSGSPVTSITQSNVISILQAVYNLIPAKLLDKEDLRIFVGMDVLRKYQAALVALNLFHLPANVDAASKFQTVLHGTNVIIEAVQGLNDTNEIYAMRLSNMAMAVDMIDEEGKFEFFYAKEAMEHRYAAAFKVGVNVAFPDEIVRFQLTA